MAKFTPIYEGRDFYVPTFEIKIAGASLPKAVQRDIIQVQYVDSIDQFDTFELTVNNWDAEKRDFKYTGLKAGTPDRSRDELFDPGQEIELWMGYHKSGGGPSPVPGRPEPLRLMLAGVIIKLAPSFPAGGQPTLKVSGKNALIKMITKQVTKTYAPGKRDSEIAKEVDQRGNLTLGNLRIRIKTDPSASANEIPHPEAVLQNNQYDILFLLQLAHRNGYDLILQQDDSSASVKQVLYFGPSVEHPPVNYLLEWGKSLVQFQPTLTTARQVSELTVRGWDAQRREAITETVKRSDLLTRPMRDRDRLYRIETGFNAREEVVVDQPFRNKQEAHRYALDRLERLSKDMVTARGSTLGVPDLRAGRKFELQKLGRTFDGQYFLKTTTHSIGNGGYTTDFEARLEEENA